MNTLYDAFRAAVADSPTLPFLCVPPLAGRDYAPEGCELSYGEAGKAVEVLIRTYRKAGYGHGHRIAFCLENRPAYILHLLALSAIGASAVPVNPDYAQGELLYLLDHSGSDLLITLDHRLDFCENVAARAAKRPPVLVFRAGDDLPEAATEARTHVPSADTEICLLYTSGTTGRPKGCILTNEYFLTAGEWYRTLGGVLDIEQGQERLFNPLPLYHMNAGALSLTCMILARGCLIVPDRFHPRSWWQEVADSRASIIHYLGIIPPLLLNQPPNEHEKRHCVKFGLGAGIEPELHRRCEERFGFPLVEVWGMTETGRILADCHEPRMIDTRAFGRPVKELEAMVVDEQDREVPRGTPGELVVRAKGDDPRKGFFAGYLNNEEATEEAWKGGWFHTGDTVRQDESGMLFFIDRKKNIIRRSGENIAAAEVEAALQSLDQVAQVAVIAVADDLRDEEVMACIVPMPGLRGDENLGDEELARTLMKALEDRLAYFKLPGWWLFLDSLPTTGTQKVQKTRIFPPDQDPREAAGIIDLRALKRRRG